MSDFLDILTHGRRLQGAVKDLTVEELESVFHIKYGMKILRNNVYIQPDDGRKLSMFLAMKV